MINRKSAADQQQSSRRSPSEAGGQGVKILSHQTSKTKLVEENKRLKEYVKASQRHLNAQGDGRGERDAGALSLLSTIGEEGELDDTTRSIEERTKANGKQ